MTNGKDIEITGGTVNMIMANIKEACDYHLKYLKNQYSSHDLVIDLCVKYDGKVIIDATQTTGISL